MTLTKYQKEVLSRLESGWITNGYTSDRLTWLVKDGRGGRRREVVLNCRTVDAIKKSFALDQLHVVTPRYRIPSTVMVLSGNEKVLHDRFIILRKCERCGELADDSDSIRVGGKWYCIPCTCSECGDPRSKHDDTICSECIDRQQEIEDGECE